ncbi:hypothetical protein NUW54_g9547 [Trametes sanguinea]|nr:hypothetical protein NUW54_g9547 [Trametes sanguinea]
MALSTLQINVRGEKGGHSGTLETPYFEIEGSQPIASPPPFTGEEDVQIGDIFYYRNTEDSRRSQMWIWQLDPTQGAYWKRVHVGYKREDGRRLTLTEKKRIPSWIGEKWYMRRGVQTSLITGCPFEMYAYAFMNALILIYTSIGTSAPSDASIALDQYMTTTSESASSTWDQASWEGVPARYLSRKAVRQLMHIKDDDYDSQLEQDYSEALQELEQLDACNAALYKAVLALKHDLTSCNAHITRLEDELVCTRQECEQRVQPAESAYRQAQAMLKKDSSVVEQYRSQCLDGMADLGHKLTRIETDTAVLKVKTEKAAEEKGELDELLKTVQLWADTTDDRLSRLEDYGDRIRTRLENVEGILDRLPMHDLLYPDPNDRSTDSAGLSVSDDSSLSASPHNRSLADEICCDEPSDICHAASTEVKHSPKRSTPLCSVTNLQSSQTPFGELKTRPATARRVRIRNGDSVADFAFLVTAVVLAHYLMYSLAVVNVRPKRQSKWEIACRLLSKAFEPRHLKQLRTLPAQVAREAIAAISACPWPLVCCIVYSVQALWEDFTRSHDRLPDASHPIWETALRHARGW